MSAKGEVTLNEAIIRWNKMTMSSATDLPRDFHLAKTLVSEVQRQEQNLIVVKSLCNHSMQHGETAEERELAQGVLAALDKDLK